MVYLLKDDVVVAVVPFCFCFALAGGGDETSGKKKNFVFWVFSRTRVSCHWLA